MKKPMIAVGVVVVIAGLAAVAYKVMTRKQTISAQTE